MKKEKERADHEIRRRERRNRKAKRSKEKRKKMEEDRREREERRIIDQNFPEMENSDSDTEEGSYSDDSDSSVDAPTLQEQLKNFGKIAATGQLFLKYTGKRRRKPQDRIVKVSFDNKYRPTKISWGSGSRHIIFSDILYIAWGHWTPVFQARKDQLKEDLCFSVVGKQQILDVQAQSKEMAELWVKGLRKLMGHSDAESDRKAKEGLESGNLPGYPGSGLSKSQQDRIINHNRTKSLIKLQQDLFVMTMTTVLRNLEEERIWIIDDEVRERFSVQSLYEVALKQDVPWRQWNQWIREKIVTYLRTSGRVVHQQPVPPQPMPYPVHQHPVYPNVYPYPHSNPNVTPNPVIHPYPKNPQQFVYHPQPRISNVMPNVPLNPNVNPIQNPNPNPYAQIPGPPQEDDQDGNCRPM